jgi:hypothetical protein
VERRGGDRGGDHGLHEARGKVHDIEGREAQRYGVRDREARHDRHDLPQRAPEAWRGMPATLATVQHRGEGKRDQEEDVIEPDPDVPDAEPYECAESAPQRAVRQVQHLRRGLRAEDQRDVRLVIERSRAPVVLDDHQVAVPVVALEERGERDGQALGRRRSDQVLEQHELAGLGHARVEAPVHRDERPPAGFDREIRLSVAPNRRELCRDLLACELPPVFPTEPERAIQMLREELQAYDHGVRVHPEEHVSLTGCMCGRGPGSRRQRERRGRPDAGCGPRPRGRRSKRRSHQE